MKGMDNNQHLSHKDMHMMDRKNTNYMNIHDMEAKGLQYNPKPDHHYKRDHEVPLSLKKKHAENMNKFKMPNMG